MVLLAGRVGIYPKWMKLRRVPIERLQGLLNVHVLERDVFFRDRRAEVIELLPILEYRSKAC